MFCRQRLRVCLILQQAYAGVVRCRDNACRVPVEWTGIRHQAELAIIHILIVQDHEAMYAQGA